MFFSSKFKKYNRYRKTVNIKVDQQGMIYKKIENQETEVLRSPSETQSTWSNLCVFYSWHCFLRLQCYQLSKSGLMSLCFIIRYLLGDKQFVWWLFVKFKNRSDKTIISITFVVVKYNLHSDRIAFLTLSWI